MSEKPIPAEVGLRRDDVERLGAFGRYERVQRRTVVPLDAPLLVVVASGYFRIFRTGAFARDVTLGLAIDGDVLGASVAYDARIGETGIEALSDGRVLYLAPDVWREHAAADAELSLRLASSLGRRLTRLYGRLERYARADAASRVVATLCELGEDFGTPVPAGGLRLDLPFAQDDLARLAGTTRETCSSVVADLARRGLVRGARLRGLHLPDLGRLAAAFAP